VLEPFHPAVRLWFERRFPEGPTPPQAGAWPSIAAGNDTLVAAPTGSGKTLSGFLVGIDQLYKAHERGEDLTDKTQDVYVSPLKALAVDIKQNLTTPH
jgi:ATP-dependent Lhr-like helicase